MGLPPWETSNGELFVLITGANSGLGYAVAARLVDEFLTSSATPPNKHLVLILCTRTPMKTRFTISRLRVHLRTLVEHSAFAKGLHEKAKAKGAEYRWEDMVQRVHFLGVEVDLCNLRSVYALAERLVNGTVGSPDATTSEGLRLPHGSPGTSSYSKDVKQDRWALSQEPGSSGYQRSWGWGLSGLRIPRLDAIILSAGMGGWTGLNWPRAIGTVLVDTVEAVTWPSFKLANIGALTRPQSSHDVPRASEDSTQPLLSSQAPDEPPLGEVFCANVLGHYILAHELMPLLSKSASPSSNDGGKIVWVSSVEAEVSHFNIDDIQGLKSISPYEDTKNLIDTMALTSSLPCVRHIAAPYFDSSNTITAPKTDTANGRLAPAKPRMYLTHPGIFASEIMPLPTILVFIYKIVFLVARWMGSPWHPIEPYKAAAALVWLTLTDTEDLEEMEGHGLRKAKWGSATETNGDEIVRKTEVTGWGWDGTFESGNSFEKRKGRRKVAVDLTKEAREDFEVRGTKVWTQMEDLRREWEGILGVRSSEKN